MIIVGIVCFVLGVNVGFLAAAFIMHNRSASEEMTLAAIRARQQSGAVEEIKTDEAGGAVEVNPTVGGSARISTEVGGRG